MNLAPLVLAIFPSLYLGLLPQKTETKPNIIFIMADDLRTELASYGAKTITPNLTKLASISRQFDRAYCQQPLCNPSRSSMLTGFRPDTLKQWNNSTHFRELNPNVKTLPQLFKENGYESRCVGKIFHNWHTEIKGDPSSWSSPEFLHYAAHLDDLPKVNGTLPIDHAKTAKCECRDVPDNAYFDGRVAEEAVNILEQIKEKPFFLAVGFWKPHAPFNAPKKYWDLYQRHQIPVLNSAKPLNAPDIAFHDNREILGIPPQQITFTPENIKEIRHGYFANISYLDAQIGKILDAIKTHDLFKNTIIVFLGDHGYHLGEHSLWGKTSCFEFDAKVPLIIYKPEIPYPGTKTTAIVECLDLYPTLTEICKFKLPTKVEGTSLVPLLNNPNYKNNNIAFTQHPRPAYYDREPSKMPTHMGYSIRTDKIRYTEWRNWKTGETDWAELYDHTSDTTELTNFISENKYLDEKTKAKNLLQSQFPKKTKP